MLKLKNIKKNNGTISAEYDPEGSGKLGKISVDIKSGEVVESEISKMDEPLPMYLHHAINALKRIMNDEKPPTEKLIMWY